MQRDQQPQGDGRCLVHGAAQGLGRVPALRELGQLQAEEADGVAGEHRAQKARQGHEQQQRVQQLVGAAGGDPLRPRLGPGRHAGAQQRPGQAQHDQQAQHHAPGLVDVEPSGAQAAAVLGQAGHPLAQGDLAQDQGGHEPVQGDGKTVVSVVSDVLHGKPPVAHQSSRSGGSRFFLR